MADIPASICLDLLRNNILATDEALVMAMLERWWRFYGIPDTGFIITSKRIVFYKSGLTGMTKLKEVSLAQLADYRFDPAEQGQLFSLVFKDDTQYSSIVRMSADDCRLVDVGLHNILTY
jgi:hypothetical protein